VLLSLPTLATGRPVDASSQTKPEALGFVASLQRASAVAVSSVTASSLKNEMTGRIDNGADGKKFVEPQSGLKVRQAAYESKSKSETGGSVTNSAKENANRETRDRKVSSRSPGERNDEMKGKERPDKAEAHPQTVDGMRSPVEQVDAPANIAPADDSSPSIAASSADAELLQAPLQEGAAPQPGLVISDGTNTSAGTGGQTASCFDASVIQQAATALDASVDAIKQTAPSEVVAAAGAVSNAGDAGQIPAAISLVSDVLRVQQQARATGQGKTMSKSGDPASRVWTSADPSGPAQPDEHQKIGPESSIAQLLKPVTVTQTVLPQKAQVPSGHGTPANQPQVTSLKSAENNSISNRNGAAANPQDQANQTQSSAPLTKPDSNVVSQLDAAPRPTPISGQLGDTASGAQAVNTAGPPGSVSEAAPHSGESASPQSAGAPDYPGRQDAEAVAPGSINVAKLIHRLNETEMQVGMHSAEFGNIAIKTSVANERLTAEITLDHNEMGKVLANQLPGLQSKLGGEYGINARIEIHENSGGFSGGLHQGSPQQSQQKWQPSNHSLSQFGAAREAEQMLAPQVSKSVAVNDDRLDVRA